MIWPVSLVGCVVLGCAVFATGCVVAATMGPALHELSVAIDRMWNYEWPVAGGQAA